MHKRRNFQFYSNLYQAERKRRLDIDNSLNIPIVILTGLVGLLYFVLSKSSHITSLYSLTIIKSCSILSIFSIASSLFFLTRAFNNWFKGFNYLALPRPSELKTYQDELVKYNQQVSKNDKVKFNDYLIGKYIEFADNNTQINDFRGVNLFYSRIAIILSLFLVLFSIIIYATTAYF